MAYYILKSYKLKIDPLRIFQVFKEQGYCFFLDSSLNLNRLGRYSFLGIDPFYILKTRHENPFEKLREIFSQYKLSLPRSNLPFLGGAVGYFAYDLGYVLEKKLNCLPQTSMRQRGKRGEDLGIPDSFFGFYNTVVIIDHFKRMIYIFATGLPERDYRLAKLLCRSGFKKVHSLISRAAMSGNLGVKTNHYRTPHPSRLNPNFTKQGYIAAVKKAKDYIKKGDIYQVNLSQRFEAETDLSDFEIYKRLRRISPSHFSAYLDCQDFQILSSSPERFLTLEGDLVTTRPMKGTRPRSANKLRDRRLKKELMQSAKDKAELTMIVDLERNDLGRVCSYGSVKVDVLRELEQYSTVFQTTATVSGTLHKDRDRMDLLRACFPGGSITGCPKIRAMEIIEELEPVRRTIYTGSLGYFSFSGGMDFNILIRTILKQGSRLYFGSGGGIVADSEPEEEYEETMVKAKAMMTAINAR